MLHRLNETLPIPCAYYRRAVCGITVVARIATRDAKAVECSACRDIAVKQMREVMQGRRQRESFLK